MRNLGVRPGPHPAAAPWPESAEEFSPPRGLTNCRRMGPPPATQVPRGRRATAGWHRVPAGRAQAAPMRRRVMKRYPNVHTDGHFAVDLDPKALRNSQRLGDGQFAARWVPARPGCPGNDMRPPAGIGYQRGGHRPLCETMHAYCADFPGPNFASGTRQGSCRIGNRLRNETLSERALE